MPNLFLSGDPEADELLRRDPLALLCGMLLDQQIPMEKAFAGPWVLVERLGRDLDAADIADRDPVEFVALFARPPAIHRFPAAMAARVQQLCRVLVADYGGSAAAVWSAVEDGTELRRRLAALPGFGPQKAAIFLALLGKQLGVTPPGWQQAADGYGEPGTYRSVADITGPQSRDAVREAKRAAKAAKRSTKPSPAAPSM
jgi:uncharacterized HhH-GPD family protein